MEYTITAFIFALLTGYVSVKYDGKIISRVAVFMLLSAAGASLVSSLDIVAQDVIENNDAPIFSVLALVIGHIGSEYITGKLLAKKTESDSHEIKNTSDLLQAIAKNKELKLETEVSIKIK